MTSSDSRIVGLLPAAGRAKRISPLPMSKELYPVGFSTAHGEVSRPKVVSQYLLERMASAGVHEAFFILRPGKWDIPAYFGDGSGVGVRLAYLTVHVPFGVPFTLDQAYPFIRGATIALGFPDMLFWPERAYRVLLRRLAQDTATLVLGLFPTDQPSQVGVVDLDARGLVRGLHEKSHMTHLPFMWAIAVWKPAFTTFLHEFIQAELRNTRKEENEGETLCGPLQRELPIGDVIHAAIQSGMRVEAEIFRDGSCIDIGTPNNLLEAIRHELPVPAPRSPEEP
jgi:glucose-1-phosphate thymidylyltransferase